MRRCRFGTALLAVICCAQILPVRNSLGASGRIAFPSGRTTLRVGSSQVIAFRSKKSPTAKQFFSFSADENLVRVLMPPTQLAGEPFGYLRLVGLRPGLTSLEVDGAKLELKIVAAQDPMGEARLTIVTPAQGTVVWGKFAVGVERFAPETTDEPVSVVLRLPGGKELQPSTPVEEMTGPSRRFFFEVDAASIATGANELIAVEKEQGGRERASEPLRAERPKTDPPIIAEGECRDQVDRPRPEKAGVGPVKLITDPAWPSGKVISNASESPAWCLPAKIAEKGDYQMFVTARGDAGGGALPTIGLVLDDQGNPKTTARLASTAWHRIAVGHPVQLDAGDHILTVRFRNDFSRGENNDRNLYLAHYELARVVDSAPRGGSELSVVFVNDVDGRVATGGVEIDALCPWKKESPPPRVQLFVNGRVVAEERSPHPRFHVPASALKPGANPAYLSAGVTSGERSRSVTENIFAPADWRPAAAAELPSFRFPVDDAAWNPELAALIHGEEREAVFYSNGETSLTLPESLEGEYVIWIAAHGDEFEGPPELSIELAQTGTPGAPLGRFPVRKNSGEIRAGVVQLHKGAKHLKLVFDNDRYESGRGDRNVMLRAVRLEPAQSIADSQPPAAKILYPSANQIIARADAVVAEVSDDRAVAAVDLRIDGEAQRLNVEPRKGFGPVVLPLLARNLEPGVHRLEVEVHDSAGNSSISPALEIQIAAAGVNVDGPYQRALLLLNRFGYGPEPNELADVLTRGPQTWLRSRLYEKSDAAAEKNLNIRLDASFPNESDQGQVVRRALKYLLATPNPVRARFVMWAENHFSTWINKIGASAKAVEDRRFVDVGPAPFFDLLLASATSPAMLLYLDQRNSVANNLNENYAREIMELHTLGVKGGYTQKDVTTLADLLTGWTTADEANADGDGDLKPDFRFDPGSSSGHFCRVLGMEFPGLAGAERFDRIRMALEMLTAHPSCAEFVCRRLAQHYVADPAPAQLVNDLAKVFRETGGDLREVLLAMSEHPEFLHAKHKVTSPLDYGVRAARMAGLENADIVRDFTSSSGMGMFDRATPDGYPEGDADFAGSNAMLQRWRFAQKMPSERLIPASWRPGQKDQTPEAARRMIDLVALRFTGDLLTDATTDAALRLLQEAPPNPDARLKILTAFIGQSPEASLR